MLQYVIEIKLGLILKLLSRGFVSVCACGGAIPDRTTWLQLQMGSWQYFWNTHTEQNSSPVTLEHPAETFKVMQTSSQQTSDPLLKLEAGDDGIILTHSWIMPQCTTYTHCRCQDITCTPVRLRLRGHRLIVTWDEYDGREVLYVKFKTANASNEQIPNI